METISVSNLSKIFKVYKRKSSFVSAVSSLFKREYRDVVAIEDISFRIKQGELVGFIGPNGAGKTTTLKCLSGLIYPTSGNLQVLGFDPFKREKKFLKQIGLVMGQKNQLWWDLPALDTFKLNKEIYEIEDEEFKKTLTELTTLLDVQNLLSIPVRQLSLGQRMKMELIASLLHKPKVLFLDEPTIGLDVVMQKKMRDFIKKYNQKYNATILLTSHYMSDVRELCKRVVVIYQGKILYDGNLDNLIGKFAKSKTFTLRFSTTIDPKKFIKFGDIRQAGDKKIILDVPKDRSKKIAKSLLSTFPIEDLNIEEPEIEDVIRSVFDQSQKNGKI